LKFCTLQATEGNFSCAVPRWPSGELPVSLKAFTISYLILCVRGNGVLQDITSSKKGFTMSIHEPANYNLESAYVLSTKWTRIAYVPPEPAESSLHPPSNFFQIHFNIIISPTPHYSKRLFSLRLSHPQYVGISLLSHPCHILRLYHPPGSDHHLA